jgi:hypothetical protein
MDIESLIDFDSGNEISFLAKGNIDPVEFCREITKEFERVLDPISVRHILARKVPFNQYDEFAGSWTLQIVSHKGRGVFPATYIEC